LILAGLIGEFCASERESSSENKRGNDFQLALSCEGTSSEAGGDAMSLGEHRNGQN
jgi:hypothetical protein